MTKEEATRLAEECGFSHSGIFPVSSLEFLPEVRDMCAADKCNRYDKCWACPPGCGTLEEIRQRAEQYDWGIVLQSTGNMEDDFDVETMMATEQEQKKRMDDFCTRLREQKEDFLPMSSGSCTICRECTYPDAPCRFPELMAPSMEAYGLVVSATCESADTPYYYGPKTMTYTGCVLFP